LWICSVPKGLKQPEAATLRHSYLSNVDSYSSIDKSRCVFEEKKGGGVNFHGTVVDQREQIAVNVNVLSEAF